MGCSAAIAGMAGGRLTYTAFGNAEDEPNQNILLAVFLRGGADGLSIVPPMSGDDRGHYEAKREQLAIPTAGENAAIRLNSRFGLHHAAAPLHELYQDGHLAIVHAAGLTSDTRSHFDAMRYMELGTPDSKSSTTGWLTRHLLSANTPSDIIVPSLAVGNLQPISLSGSTETIGMNEPDDFDYNGHWRYGDWQRQGLRNMYSQGNSWLHQSGLQTLDALDVIEYGAPDKYVPENGAEYPTGEFGRNLQTVAQIIKMQLGLQVATVDLGGWDTHEYQGNAGRGYFSNLLEEMSRGLHALYTDLSNSNGTDYNKRLTMVVMSEFGRSFQENASRGTDHGHGNVMFVLGGEVNGGMIYGDWPGLAMDQLYDRRDLAITTDYRQVLSEILIRRQDNPNLGVVFPNYQGYEPLDIVQGIDQPPVYDETIAATATPLPATGEPTATSEPVATATNTMTPTSVTVATALPVPTATPTAAPTSTATARAEPTYTPLSLRPDGASSDNGFSMYLPFVEDER